MTNDILRWHSNPNPRLRLSGDTVKNHQQRVAALCFSLAARIGHPLYNSDLIKAAMHHDDAEAVLGDMPGPAKQAFPALAAAYAAAERAVLADMGLTWHLTPEEEAMLNLCDKLDALQWAILHNAADGEEWQRACHKLMTAAYHLGAGDWLNEQIDAAVDKCNRVAAH